MYFTFTYSSWLDQVERWAALLTDKRLRLATHTSVAALEKTSATGSPNGTKTQSRSHGPKPPTKILERLAASLLRIHGARHQWGQHRTA
jgi:hypothetical protein